MCTLGSPLNPKRQAEVYWFLDPNSPQKIFSYTEKSDMCVCVCVYIFFLIKELCFNRVLLAPDSLLSPAHYVGRILSKAGTSTWSLGSHSVS